MRLFLAGDTHGNTEFLCDYLYPLAKQLKADVILQLGDFGYWEHHDTGVEFLDRVDEAARDAKIPCYWLHGNHDKHSLALTKYGDNRTDDGFIICRPAVFYIPTGHIWTTEGHRMRVFGGAYSVDKQERLQRERAMTRQAHHMAALYRSHGAQLAGAPPDFTGHLWFPEEETPAEEFDYLLAQDSSQLSVVFSHDKPIASNVGRPGFKDLPNCMPNQRRLQQALLAHQPTYWFHGHLHLPYTDHVRSGDDAAFTTVVGLSCDDRARRFGKPWHAWGVLDLKRLKPPVWTPGKDLVDDLDDEDGPW
jgi:DNA repair exonuclease SbcCD nuclease subunit